MFCQKCGEEINDEAVVCTKCGCAVEKNSKPVSVPDEEKTGIGIAMGLFLGVIGLIIGLCLYKDGTIARQTFIKSWTITFCITFVVGLIIGIVSYVNAINTMENMFNSMY